MGKTTTYKTPAGRFDFRSLKPDLFFDYTILRSGGLLVIMESIIGRKAHEIPYS
jgi:hypothetical protein